MSIPAQNGAKRVLGAALVRPKVSVLARVGDDQIALGEPVAEGRPGVHLGAVDVPAVQKAHGK